MKLINFRCHFLVLWFRPKSRTTLRPVCLLMWPPQASGRQCFNIRNQSPPSLFVPVSPWCHCHEAARWWAESDGYLYRNISFPPPASVHIKSLARHISLLSPWPSLTSAHKSNPHVEALSSSCTRHRSWLPSRSDAENPDNKLCHLYVIAH